MRTTNGPKRRRPGQAMRQRRTRRDEVGRCRLALEELEHRVTPSLALPAVFGGLNAAASGGYVPPDTDLAAGANYLVETVNQSYQVYNKTTHQAVGSPVPFSSFFGPLPAYANLADPGVTYDDAAGRFVMGDMEYNFSPTTPVANYDIAISQTADPTGGWTKARIPTLETIGGVTYVNDFPRIGFNADVYVVTLNMYRTDNGQFGHVQILVINKSGQLLSRTDGGTSNPLDITMVPAAMHGSHSGDPMWLVEENYNSYGTSMRVVKMTNLTSGAPILTYTAIGLPAQADYQSITTTNWPQDPGGPIMNYGGQVNIDTRILSVAYANNALVAAQNVGTASVTHARYYAFGIVNGVPQYSQYGDINPGANIYTFYPSIDINQATNKLAMTFLQSSSSSYVSMYATGRLSSDAAGTLETPLLVQAGTSHLSGGRGGDFSGTSLDPVNGTFWTANEYATNAASPNWGTEIANVLVDFPPVSYADAYSVNANKSLTTSAANGVLANDFDSENDPLTAVLQQGPTHGTLNFFNSDGSFKYTPSIASGTDSFTYYARDAYGNGNVATVTINIVSAREQYVATASSGEVKVYDAALGNALKYDFFPYGSGYTGEVRVAIGDVNGDGVPDIICAPGPNDGSIAKSYINVFDGASAGAVPTEFWSFLAYASGWNGGVFVAAGDLKNNGRAQIVTGPDYGGGPDVRIYDYPSLSIYAEFYAYAPGFLGGVRVAVGHLKDTTHFDIATAPGPAGSPDMRIFYNGNYTGTPDKEFLAYDPSFAGGVYLAVGDVTGDGLADIVTGPGAGGGPDVRVFYNGNFTGAPTPNKEFWAYDPSFAGGVRVAIMSDINGDGHADIVTAPGSGGGPDVRVFDSDTLAKIDEFYAFNPNNSSGVFVGGN